MAYEPTIWKDRAIERPKTFNIVNNPDGTVTLVPVTGAVAEPGTPVNATNLNKLEQAIKTHEADNANPHNVNKEDVGLSNVENYGKATLAESQAGTSDVKVMTPLMVKNAITALESKTVYGTYTGNGTTNRTISVGFTPKLVIILSTTAATTHIVVDTYCFRGNQFGDIKVATYIEIVAGGFKLAGTGADNANTNSTVYKYVAIQ